MNPDADEDGYGSSLGTDDLYACSQPDGSVDNGSDCDDSDASVHSDGTEVCNWAGDNCNGLDSDSVCPCNLEDRNGHSYRFCEGVVTWWDARDACLDQGNFDLATIDDASENNWVYRQAMSHGSDTVWWWRGCHDTGASAAEEPQDGWEWVDGSTSTYQTWAGSQPDDYLDDEDCPHIYSSDGTWNDMDRDRTTWSGVYTLSFVCESG